MQPNIVVVTCDQLRACDVGCYGNSVVRTPHIDRLAAGGVRCETAVTNNPVCTPARSCLMSGQYSRTCAGHLGNAAWDPPTLVRRRMVDSTLAEELRGAGYATALVGKWHVDPSPMIVGFDRAVWPLIIHRYRGQRYFIDGRSETVVDGFGPEWKIKQVESYLDEPRDRPFFLFYNISPPHEPIGTNQIPPRYAEMYDRDTVPLHSNVWANGRMAHDENWFKIYQHWGYWWRYWDLSKRPHYTGYPRGGSGPQPGDVLPDGFDLRDLLRLYYGAITCVDDLVGRLMATLAARRLTENTIVVFVSDHGDNMGSHQLFNKSSLFEESIRVPMVFHWPTGLRPGVLSDHVTQLIDIMPTVLDLTGAPIPPHVQGRSLASVLRGQSDEATSRHAFIEIAAAHGWRPMIGVRTPTYVYGVELDAQARQMDAKAWGFFDLQNDPYQMRNLAETGESQRQAHELRDALELWNASTPWRHVEDDESTELVARKR